MRPIKTADDVVALTRDELWNAPTSDLRVLQTYPPELTGQVNQRQAELLPDVVELCDVAVKAFNDGDRSGAQFAPIAVLPPFPLVFAFTRLMRDPSNHELAKHVHGQLAKSVMKLFSVELP